jgi:hypothetical protein
MWQLVLRAIRDETHRTGVEETNVSMAYIHLNSVCALEGININQNLHRQHFVCIFLYISIFSLEIIV